MEYKYSMKKYIINLERRQDRKTTFNKTNSFLTDCEFVDAVDGTTLTPEILLQNGLSTNRLWRDPFQNRKLTKGEVGCYLSHRSTWELCVKLNEPIMVFEDDAIVDEKLFDEEYYNSLTKDYGFIYLNRLENEPDKVKSIDDKLEVPFYPYNLTAYVITPVTARKLLSVGIENQIIPADEFIPIMLQNGHINAVTLKEDSVNQQPRKVSDVENDDWFIDFKTHVITVGTDRKKCANLNDSAMINGIHPKNLGKTVDWKGTDMSGPGGGMKINLIKEHIKTLPDNDIVLFTDAYDVFYADDLETIVNRYLGFHTKVLFAAEPDCWPDSNLADKFPKSETKYRFLNSGIFIGEVRELKRIFEEEIENNGDDQLYIHNKFLSNEFDIKLDYEAYIFQCHDLNVRKDGNQIFNPDTRSYSCIYHGNGGEEAKRKFDGLYRQFFPKFPQIFIPTYGKFDIIDKDMLVVDFMTQSQCEDIIDIADNHGKWEPLEYDKFPAYEIRLKELGLWDELEKHWQKHIYPIVERYWNPIEMYGMRDAFVMRYSADTQTCLPNHHDASLVTGSIKLNDDYEGAELVFGRQNVSNKDIAVGRAVLFPGQVTHGHECTELLSGVKYSMTMWSKRHPDDYGG